MSTDAGSGRSARPVLASGSSGPRRPFQDLAICDRVEYPGAHRRTAAWRASDVGLVSAARWLPYLLWGLVVGVLVDRSRHRPLLVATDFGRAALLVAAPVLARPSRRHQDRGSPARWCPPWGPPPRCWSTLLRMSSQGSCCCGSRSRSPRLAGGPPEASVARQGRGFAGCIGMAPCGHSPSARTPGSFSPGWPAPS